MRALVCISLLVLAGCFDSITDSRTNVQRTTLGPDMATVSYNGHEYIFAEHHTGVSGAGGLVHSPDCSCHKNKAPSGE